jgi:hypothetical protein
MASLVATFAMRDTRRQYERRRLEERQVRTQIDDTVPSFLHEPGEKSVPR